MGLQSLAIFFISSMGASLMNYIFQLVVARKLGGPEFAQFTLEWSYISIFFISGAFANYFSALNRFSKIWRQRLFLGVQGLALLMLLGSAFGSLRWLSLAVVLENLLQNLILGHCLGLKNYKMVNALNLLVGVFRLVAAFALPAAWLNLTGLFLTIFFSFFVAHIFYLLSPPAVENPEQLPAPRNWAGPVLLAVVTGVLPQVDILWVSYFLDAGALVWISELSLVSKAVFYTQLIVAQWLLPKDTREHHSWLELSVPRQIAILGLLLALSIALGGVAALILPRILNWPNTMGLPYFILISAIGTLTSVFFMTLQAICKTGRVGWPAGVFLGLLAVAGALGFAQVSLGFYLSVSVAGYLIGILVLFARLKSLLRFAQGLEPQR